MSPPPDKVSGYAHGNRRKKRKARVGSRGKNFRSRGLARDFAKCMHGDSYRSFLIYLPPLPTAAIVFNNKVETCRKRECVNHVAGSNFRIRVFPTTAAGGRGKPQPRISPFFLPPAPSAARLLLLHRTLSVILFLARDSIGHRP